MNVNDLVTAQVTVNWLGAGGYTYTLLPPTTTRPATMPSQAVVYNFVDLLIKVSAWISAFDTCTVLNIRFSDETPKELIVEFMQQLPTYMNRFRQTPLSAIELHDKRVDIIR